MMCILVRKYDKTHLVCCKDFAKAMEDNTDHESYGPVIYDYENSDNFVIGSVERIPPIKYCPWCRRKIEMKI